MPTSASIETAATRNSKFEIGSSPELLAPAGDWDCVKAAVENGADAIYFGLEKFNARMRAHNFTEADLPKLMEFLHRRGVKGYVTFNTLIFENEMAQAEQYLRAIIAAGVDAAIVQDVGICRLIRQLSPDFPIHASTQMTITRKSTNRATLISPVRATGRPPFGVSPKTAATAVMSAAAMSHVYQVMRRRRAR